MGCCGSAEGSDVDHDVSKGMKAARKEAEGISKLLLLGTGASGKSTIFKNLRQNNGDNVFDARAMDETANTLRSSLVQYMMRILLAATAFEELNDPRYAGCKADMENAEVRENIEQFMGIYCILSGIKLQDIRRNPLAEVDMGDHLHEHGDTLGRVVATLWSQSWVQNTYKNRGGHFSMPDNLPHFFPRAQEIMDRDFQPSKDDMIRTRVRTTGVIHYTYTFEDTVFTVIDVGGQRSERGKWRRQFDDVAALLFVTALNHYNEVLFEDETENAMHEAIKIFADYINDAAFVETSIILFFNKVDLFDEYIKEFPLGVCFSEAQPKWKGPEFWNGPDYALMPGVEAPEDWESTRPDYETARGAALKFIQDTYESRDKMPDRRIYKHVTCATNPDNVKEVFWDIQNIVIKENLVKSGLMPQH